MQLTNFLAIAVLAAAQAQTFKDKELPKMQNSALREISGLSRSSRADVVWAHNDSGDKARIFAVDTKTGNTIAEVRLKDTRARDFEDMAFNDGQVFVGDIGDNGRRRSYISIYRFQEPLTTSSNTQVRADRFKLKYPDGRENAEALMVDPRTGDVFLISKRPRHAQLFQLPIPTRPTRSTGTIIELDKLPGIKEAITGSDISPDGSEILVVGKDHVFLFERKEGETVPEAMKRDPKVIGSSVKGQCEAIAFENKLKNPGFFSITEGKRRPMHFFERE